MRALAPRLMIPAALAALFASPAAAQSRDEPSLAFTISGGLSTGGDLWQINRQVLRDTLGVQDTATVGRLLRPGLTASLAVSYFQSPHLGFNAAISYYGLGTRQACAGPTQYNSTFNQTVCSNATGTNISSSVIAFQVGATYRIRDPRKTSPYVRGNIGFGFIDNSFVETSGFIQEPSCQTVDNVCEVKIIAERNPHSVTWTASFAGGISFPFGSGYRISMEAQDLVTALPVINSPALIGTSNQPVSQSHMAVKNVPIFTFGFDVLLERSHPRRY